VQAAAILRTIKLGSRSLTRLFLRVLNIVEAIRRHNDSWSVGTNHEKTWFTTEAWFYRSHATTTRHNSALVTIASNIFVIRKNQNCREKRKEKLCRFANSCSVAIRLGPCRVTCASKNKKRRRYTVHDGRRRLWKKKSLYLHNRQSKNWRKETGKTRWARQAAREKSNSLLSVSSPFFYCCRSLRSRLRDGDLQLVRMLSCVIHSSQLASSSERAAAVIIITLFWNSKHRVGEHIFDCYLIFPFF